VGFYSIQIFISLTLSAPQKAVKFSEYDICGDSSLANCEPMAGGIAKAAKS
jgi:hypothetical protein